MRIINNNSKDSIQVGKVKVSSNSSTMPGTILMVIGGIFIISDWLSQLLDYNEKRKKESDARKTDNEIRVFKEKAEAETKSYKEKHQADADLYERKWQADVEKEKQLRELKADNVDTGERMEAVDDQIESEPTIIPSHKPKSFMDNFKKEIGPITMATPLILDDFIDACSENLKIPMYYSLLAMLGARCFSKVRAIGPDGTKHAPNIMVIVKALNGTGKGCIRNVYKKLFDQEDDTEAASCNARITQSIGMNNTTTQWITMLQNNRGVHMFALEEEIKQVTKALKSQNNPGYEILRVAFDNGTISKGTANNPNPKPVEVFLNIVAMGNPDDVETFFKGQVGGGTLSRFIWTVIEEKDGNARFNMPDHSKVERLQGFIKECQKKYCYSTDKNGEDRPCEEHLIDLSPVCDALEKWCEKQRAKAKKENNNARDRMANRISTIAFHCAIVIYMLYVENNAEEDLALTYTQKNSLFIADYCMERYLFLFGSEENAQTKQFREKEQIFNAKPDSNKSDDIYPGVSVEMAKQMYDAYEPNVHGPKAILTAYGKQCGLTDATQVKRVIQKYAEQYEDPKGIMKTKDGSKD